VLDEMIHVMVVHEFPLMCNIIASVLEGEGDIAVIGRAASVEQALKLIKNHKVDVALISSRLPEQGALALTNVIGQSASPIKILILGITETRENVLRYIEAGAAGYVLRESSLDELLATIRSVNHGQAVVSPEIAATLIERVSEYSHVVAHVDPVSVNDLKLTSRETEVLELLSQNLSNHEIAHQLVIELGTVKNHVHSILNKLGVSSREDAARLMHIIRKHK